jgi:hypothetical protein
MREFYIVFSSLGWAWCLLSGLYLAIRLRPPDNQSKP